MLKRRPNESFEELKSPGDDSPELCAPGSIEQQLDMCETGTLRGDEILHSHGQLDLDGDDLAERGADVALGRFGPDMAERDREGSEESGDEHSSGYQGFDTDRSGMSGNQQDSKIVEAQSDYLRQAEDENMIPLLNRGKKKGRPKSTESN